MLLQCRREHVQNLRPRNKDMVKLGRETNGRATQSNSKQVAASRARTRGRKSRPRIQGRPAFDGGGGSKAREKEAQKPESCLEEEVEVVRG